VPYYLGDTTLEGDPGSRATTNFSRDTPLSRLGGGAPPRRFGERDCCKAGVAGTRTRLGSHRLS